MLIYNKENKLYGSFTNTPNSTDEPILYLDKEQKQIILNPNDTYLDDGQGGIIRKSDNQQIDVYLDFLRVVPHPAQFPDVPDFKKHSDYLYEITLDDVDYIYADHFFRNPYAIAAETVTKPGACTSVWKDGVLYRNFDWNYNYDVAFVLHIPQKDNDDFFVHGKRFASDGVADSIPYLNLDMIKSKQYTNGYKILPFYTMDGKNENGVVVSKNVVPRQHGDNLRIEPEIETRYEIQASALTRFILDNFESADEAIEYIKNYVLIYPNEALKASNYDLHYIIADKNHPDYAYIAELIDNKFVYKKFNCNDAVKPIMTNFHIFIDVNGNTITLDDGHVYTPLTVADNKLPSTQGITSHAAGLERYNIIMDNYADLSNFRQLVLYNNAYTFDKYDNCWYSEFVGNYPGDIEFTVDTEASKFYELLMPYIWKQYKQRSRKDGSTWHTTHSSYYDLINNELTVFDSSEDEIGHKFKL